jgi:hypothetical protein
LKVTSSEVKGGVKDPLALFGVSGIEGVRGTHIRDREVVKPEIPFRVKVVVTSVGHVGKSLCLVLVRTGVTPKKDLWKHLCVEDSCGESKSQSDSKGRLRTILRLGGQAEPAEVGVLPLLRFFQ